MDLYKKHMETKGSYDNPIELNDDSDLDDLSDGYNSPSESPEFPPSPPIMDDFPEVDVKRNKDSKKPTYVHFNHNIDIEKLEEIDVVNFHHFEEEEQNSSPDVTILDTPPREKKRNVRMNHEKHEPPAKKVRFAANVDYQTSNDNDMSDPDYEDEGSPDNGDEESSEDELDAATLSNYEECFYMGRFENYDKSSQDLIIKFQTFASKYFKKIRLPEDAVTPIDQNTNTWYTNLYEYDEKKLLENCNADSHTAAERSFFKELVTKIRVYVLKPRVNDSNVIRCIPMNKRWGSLEYNNYLSAGDWHDFYILEHIISLESTLHLNNTVELINLYKRNKLGSIIYGTKKVLMFDNATNIQVPLDCYREVRAEVAKYLHNRSLPVNIHTNDEKVKILHNNWREFGSVVVEYAYDQYHRDVVLRRLRQTLIIRKCFFVFSRSQSKREVRNQELYLVAIDPNIANTGTILNNLFIIYLHRIENVLLPVGDPVGYEAREASRLCVSFSFLMHPKDANFVEGGRVYRSLPLNDIVNVV